MPIRREHIADRLVDLPSRITEVVAGIIMALTFTGTLSAAEGGQAAVRTMLFAALGCNAAWGIVDGVLFMTGRQAERGRRKRLLRVVQRSRDAQRARRVIADALPPVLASITTDEELESMRTRLAAMEPPQRKWLELNDVLGCVFVFLLVFLSTFPIAVPFLIFDEQRLALRISNGIAIVMLFMCGLRLGHYAGHRPWGMGLLMAALGAVLVVVTIALGG
jgi:VIT1/CCC1 family predicted Fe2+/Mn2+ transporter